MSRYGSNYYELAYYGAPNVSFFTALNFKAVPKTFGSINVRWTSPAGNWSKIKLTRNTYGYPVNPWDGVELDIGNDDTYYAFKETDPTIFDDTENIAYNTFYYYSLFVFQNATKRWQRVGNTAALSAYDYGYTDLMYEYLPEVYKVNSLNDPFVGSYNEDLYNFLSLFGFQLSLIHTYTNLLVNRYDTEKVGGMLLPAFMQQFGLAHEPEIGYQQERVLLQNSAISYKEKGAAAGLMEFIKSYSGYAISTTSSSPNPPIDGFSIGKNIMLDYNDSSFEEGVGHWATPDSSASLFSLTERRIKALQLLSNVATLTVEPHNYQVGNKVYISGCSFPLFNKTTTPVTITARTSTSISFALTGENIDTVNAFNNTTDTYPIIYPYPKAWQEPTSLNLYPNKRKGILSVKNSKTPSGTVKIQCGYDNAVLKGIPVTAGQVYSFSVYSSGDVSARNVTVGIDWYNRFGVYLSSSNGSATSNLTGQFTVRIKVENKTAPADAYYAVPTISIAAAAGSASNEWHYFDAAQFEQVSAATSFEEARQINVILKATRINELTNPHFKLNMSLLPEPWEVTGATFDIVEDVAPPTTTIYNTTYLSLDSGTATLESLYSSDIVQGAYVYVSGVTGITNGVYEVLSWQGAASPANSYITFDTGGSTTAPRTAVNGTFFENGSVLKVIPTSSSVSIDSWDGSTTSQQIPVHYSNADYTFSVYSKGTTINDNVTLSIKWYDDTNTLISTSVGDTFTVSSLLTGTAWDRNYITAASPEDASYATVHISLATSVGNTFNFESALFERESFALPFFDGDVGSSESTDFIWEGVADASRSHYYKNYKVFSTRLASEALNDELLLGTTVAVYYAQSNT